MSTPRTLAALVREILADPPINHCADDGVSCPHCNEWRPSHYNRPEIEHGPECWYTLARAALDRSATVYECSEWDGTGWEHFATCATIDAARVAWGERMKHVTFAGDPIEVFRDGMKVGGITASKLRE